MSETTKGRTDEAKRAIGTTLLLLDYANVEELHALTAMVEKFNRGLSQRFRRQRAETEAVLP
jgi:hypothetical protein